MRVRDLMQTHLRTVASDATVDQAIEALVTAHVSGLPVIDRFGRAVGVFSARHVLQLERERLGDDHRAHLFTDVSVLEVMQAWVPTIDPEASVRRAAQAMLDSGEQRLFVTENGALVGVITLTDVARAFALETAEAV